MQTHVKVLGVLYLAVSAFFLVGALFLILASGSAAGIVGRGGGTRRRGHRDPSHRHRRDGTRDVPRRLRAPGPR